MRIAVISPLVIGLLIAAPIFAQTAVIELDIDGVSGNGPDLWMPSIGDSVDVDVLLYGDPPPDDVCSFFISVFAAGDVECARCVYRTPPGWRTTTPRNGDGLLLQGMDPTFTSPLQMPAVIATLTLRASVVASGSGLHIDESSWFATATGNRIYPAVDGGAIEIEALAAEKSSWSDLKRAYR
ncbi:MAG: hypothetical protein JW958_13385 [Candidatus Eisenbacteria bacterium]|nr:hypothetical protein [Candidatus Eisenbacteria bacterium]